MIRTLKYRSKYQNSRPVELQTKCYLARTTAPQNPQRNVSSEANSTPRVLVSGWEGFNQLPFCSFVFWTELWTSFKFKCWKTLELLFTTCENNWKYMKSWDQQIWIPTILYFLCFLIFMLSSSGSIWRYIWRKRDFWASEVAKDLDTTWHNPIRMYPHVGFNVKQHIEPKPHGIL